jgi:hypothetical protein
VLTILLAREYTEGGVDDADCTSFVNVLIITNVQRLTQLCTGKRCVEQPCKMLIPFPFPFRSDELSQDLYVEAQPVHISLKARLVCFDEPPQTANGLMKLGEHFAELKSG